VTVTSSDCVVRTRCQHDSDEIRPFWARKHVHQFSGSDYSRHVTAHGVNGGSHGMPVG
jgi:hypothetical protein